jgi:hypothetical protein
MLVVMQGEGKAPARVLSLVSRSFSRIVTSSALQASTGISMHLPVHVQPYATGPAPADGCLRLGAPC